MLSFFNWYHPSTGTYSPMMTGLSSFGTPSMAYDYKGEGLDSYCYSFYFTTECTSATSGLRLSLGYGLFSYMVPVDYGYNGQELEVVTFHSNSDINAVQTVSFTYDAATAPFVAAAGVLVCGLVTATAM